MADDLNKLTFKGNRKLVDNGSVHIFALCDGKARLCKLIGNVISRYDTDVVTSRFMLFIRYTDGEAFIYLQIVGGLMVTQIHDQLVSAADASPSRIHGIGITFLIISTDYHYGLRKQPRLYSEIFTHSITSALYNTRFCLLLQDILLIFAPAVDILESYINTEVAMTLTKAILCCLFTSFAVHYGWKMRGTVIGGEKGAMVPGLFCGLSLSLFAGGEIGSFFCIPAAAGLIGMSYGGIEPYGDNIAWIMDKHEVEPNPKKGYGGLALKGALWFSIAGGYMGMSFSAMGGRYSVKDILIFIALTFILQSVGYGIFNQPYDKGKGIHPKIYLTYESRDEWGSNVGVLTAILIMAVINRDLIAVRMTACGLIFGAVGWIIAMRLYYYTEHTMKNGKYLLGVLSEKKLCGGWGNMEYCLGSFGGLGIALGFVLSGNDISEINKRIRSDGIFSPLGNYDSAVISVFIFLFAVLLFINILEYELDKKSKKYNSFLMDCIERPFFNTLPFIFILMCSLPAAKLMTAFMALYVLFLKNMSDRFRPGKARNIFIIVSVPVLAVTFVLTLVTSGPSPLLIFISGGIPYIILEVVWKGITPKYGGWKSMTKLNEFTYKISLLTLQSTVIAVVGGLIINR